MKQHVEDKLKNVLPKSSAELNEAVDSITWLLTSAYENSCPEMKAVRKKDGKLWSTEIENGSKH